MGQLDLPDCPHSRVFLRTCEILVEDDTLARTVQTWILPDGRKDPNELSGCFPLVRLEPNMSPMQWFDPSSQSSWLVINIRTCIQSRDATDRLNLWAALVNALYPFGQYERQLQIQQSLRDAGAEIGQYEFNLPATTPDPRSDQDGYQVCDGQLRISVVWTFNP